MTAIVGLIHEDGEVWLGTDSLTSFGQYGVPNSSPKMFRADHADLLGPMLIGVSGSPRVAQLLAYSFTPPAHEKSIEVLSYFCGPFAKKLRLHLVENAAWDSSDETIRDTAHLVIGYLGHLIYGDSALAFYEPICGYEASGSGAEVAAGSLFTTAKLGGVDGRGRVQLALEAAAASIISVAPPFHIEKL